MSVARALLAATVLVPCVASADIYQYTDKDGVVHIVNSAPHGVNAQLLVRGGNAPRSGAPIVAPSDHDPARFTRFDEWIRQACTLYQIPEQLVRAVIKVESDYDPRAISIAGARGLMQLMPDTAERMQVRDIDNPRENIFGGVRLLRILANAFNGDLSLTIAAYNAGPDAVMRHGGIPPFEQTKNYVVKVTSYYRRYRSIPDIVEASVGG